MTMPSLSKTWIFDKDNRITYVSLADTMQNFLFGLKDFLKSNGYTVKFSAAGGVGPSGPTDATDRWSNAAAVTPRATVAAASQAWIVLQDAAGFQILFAWQGGTDDVCRVSFSSTGFTLAGTTTHQPTAADEAVITDSTSVIASTTSGDRIWHACMTNDAKLFRVFIARGGIVVGYIAIGAVNPSVVPPMSSTLLCHGHFVRDEGNMSVAQLFGTTFFNGKMRCSGGVGSTIYGSTIPSNVYAQIGNVKPEAQGSVGYLVGPVQVWGYTTVGARGKFGDMIDMWIGRAAAGSDTGDTYDATLNHVQVGEFIFAWDGLAVPVLT